MSDALIRKLFTARLIAYAEPKDYPIAFENMAFDKSDVTHLELFVIPANTTSNTLEGTDTTYIGIVQINIKTPQNVGPGLAETIAAELKDLFPVNLQLTDSDFKVNVNTPPAKARSFPSGSMWLTPVSFRYRADTV